MGGRDRDELDAPIKELFELSPDPILLFVGGIIVNANPAAVSLLRAPSRDALIGVNSRALLHPDCHGIVERNAAVIMSGEVASTRSEEKYVRLDGTVVEVEATAARATFLAGKAFIVILRDITDRREAEERRRREREIAERATLAQDRARWLGAIIDVLPSLVFARDERGAFVLVNRRFAEHLGRSPEEIMGRTPAELGLPNATSYLEEDREILASGEPKLLPERVIVDVQGRRRVLEGVKVKLALDGQRTVVLGALNDLTERRELEAQLAHSQKMDGIGRVAGGVAHDFNNILTVIIESADHLARTAADPEGDLARIREASTRAAALTRQLLTFARQAPSSPRVVLVDDIVREMARLLERVLGEDVALRTDLRASGGRAMLDPGQFEVVLMNLAVNARDAMPQGGKLLIATRLVDGALDPAAPARTCVLVEVSDTGCGMEESVRARAFEPFFTTKKVGKGTGLGLSTSYGIVQELGGRIEIDSALGKGTTVRVLLPACSKARAVDEAVRLPDPPPGKGETVLLLEDDAIVRRSTQRLLRSLGYEVLEAALPTEAIALARAHGGPIDVLVTDVIMPEMTGVEAAKVIRELRPTAAVLYVSGYSDDAFDLAPGETPPRSLSKPFTRVEMATKLREVLEAKDVRG